MRKKETFSMLPHIFISFISTGNHDTPSAAPHRNKLVVELAMFSRDRFSLRIPSGWREDVMRTARLVPDARDERDGKHTLVTIPLSAYHSLVDSLRQLPDLALHLFYGPVYDIYIAKKPPVHVDFPPIASKLPKKLNDILLPFQRVGVEFALRRGGRVLIGDEMGLGKTLQGVLLFIGVLFRFCKVFFFQLLQLQHITSLIGRCL